MRLLLTFLTMIYGTFSAKAQQVYLNAGITRSHLDWEYSFGDGSSDQQYDRALVGHNFGLGFESNLELEKSPYKSP